MSKVTILENFATIGVPTGLNDEFEKGWNIVALSERLIDESRLNGLGHSLNTRRLDCVMHNGNKFAILNLQTFKLFDCPTLKNTFLQCSTHYFTPNGLFFGILSSGDIVVVTHALQRVKYIKKPDFINNMGNLPKKVWYQEIPAKIYDLFTKSSSRNQVAPFESQNTLDEMESNSRSKGWWPSSWSSWLSSGDTSLSTTVSQTRNIFSSESSLPPFPYITALPDGLATFCAFSPVYCYVFVPSYSTLLRSKSIANIKGDHVPGHFYRIIMHNAFIVQWLEEAKKVPWFEARLCYEETPSGKPVIGGAITYAVQKGFGVDVAYGYIKRRGEKFTLTWDKVRYEVDCITRSLSGATAYNPEDFLRFVTRISLDCKKVAVVVSTGLGVYSCVQKFPVYPEGVVHLARTSCGLCSHSDYDGRHFYKKDCWISDCSWLVEDAYIACFTLCGCLSTFYAETGETMILKVKKTREKPDDDKSARYFFPVFNQNQIRPEMSTPFPQPLKPVIPTMKWLDSEKVLVCSTGSRIELFSFQRVMSLPISNISPITVPVNVSLKRNKSKSRTEVSNSSETEISAAGTSSSQTLAVSNLEAGNSTATTQEKTKVLSELTYAPPQFSGCDADANHHHISFNDLSPASIVTQNVESLVRPVSVYLSSTNLKRSPSPRNRASPRYANRNNISNSSSIFKRTLTQQEQQMSASLSSLVQYDLAGGMDEFDDEEGGEAFQVLPVVSSRLDMPLDYRHSDHFVAKEDHGLVETVLDLDGTNKSDADIARKQASKLYMADDELSDDGKLLSTNESINQLRWKEAISRQSQTHLRTSSITSLGKLETDHTYTSYSSPFSGVPTSGEDDDANILADEAQGPPNEEDHVSFYKPSKTPVPSSSGRESLGSASSIQIKLQIPPVPVISAVVIPPTRSSEVVEEGIQVDPNQEPGVSEGTQIIEEEEAYIQPMTTDKNHSLLLMDIKSKKRVSSGTDSKDNQNEMEQSGSDGGPISSSGTDRLAESEQGDDFIRYGTTTATENSESYRAEDNDNDGRSPLSS